MHTLRSKLIAVAAIVVLAVIGSLTNSRQAAAQGPPDGLAVRIVNPLPVPVSGSTAVSGTVGATQSGTWNVGITNGTATTPIFVKNVDEPGRSPYQQTVHGTCGTNFCDFGFTPPPAGKRLVLQHMSGSLIASNGNMVAVELFFGPLNSTSDQFKRFTAKAVFQFRSILINNNDQFAVNEPILAYVDPSDTRFQVSVTYSSTVAGLFDQEMTVVPKNLICM